MIQEILSNFLPSAWSIIPSFKIYLGTLAISKGNMSLHGETLKRMRKSLRQAGAYRGQANVNVYETDTNHEPIQKSAYRGRTMHTYKRQMRA
jgi:hypothetical protein